MVAHAINFIDFLINRKCKGQQYNKDEAKLLFPFLGSAFDFDADEWLYFEPSKTKPAPLKFDCAVIGGGLLSQRRLILEDIKTSFLLVTKKSFLKGEPAISSGSAATGYIGRLQLIYNEMVAAGIDITRSEEIDIPEYKDLLTSITQARSVSQDYLGRLQSYVGHTGIEHLPVRTYDRGKSKPHIDTAKISAVMGLNHRCVWYSQQCKKYFAEVSLRHQELFPQLKTEIKYESSLKGEGEPAKITIDTFEDTYAVLRIISKQSEQHPELFNYSWVMPDVDIKPKKFFNDNNSKKKETNERTRNIPYKLFLSLMTSSARYILDYSDALFLAEEELKAYYEQLESEGVSDAGKRTNQKAREMGRVVDGDGTPFPLAAYKLKKKGTKKVAPKLLENVFQMIDDGCRPKDIQEALGITKPQYDGYKKLKEKGRAYGRDLPHTGISLQKALYQFLPFCCVCIIFAFTARREMEVFGLKVGCISEPIDGHFYIKKAYVAKTEREYRDFTTVSIVAKAVKVLEKLSERGRLKAKSDSLFVFDDPLDRDPISMDRINRIANHFFEFIDVDSKVDGEPFQLSEHQFRRFFVMMFFYRYEGSGDSKFDALMYELGHKDPDMTARYLTEKEFGLTKQRLDEEMAEIIAEVGAERVADFAFSPDLGGPMFTELRNALIDSFKIADELRSDRELKKHATAEASKRGYVLEFINCGVCFGLTAGRAESGLCYESGHLMIHRASKELCAGCPNFLSVPNIAAGHMKFEPNSECGECECSSEIVAAATVKV